MLPRDNRLPRPFSFWRAFIMCNAAPVRIP